MLCTASSLSSAHPPQVSPCHRLPPSASCCHGFLFCLPQCFMNSILQCLSNTKELRDYCLQNQYLRDLNNNSRMRTALMSGNHQSLAPGSAPGGASLQHVPAARPCSPRPPHVLGEVLLPSLAGASTALWVPSQWEDRVLSPEGTGPTAGTPERGTELSLGGHGNAMPPGLAGASRAADLPLCPQSLPS